MSAIIRIITKISIKSIMTFLGGALGGGAVYDVVSQIIK
jgi:hypothetical protein